MYSLLREEDVLEMLHQNTLKCEKIKNILSLEQHGNFEIASNEYINILNHKNNKIQIYQKNSYNVEGEFIKIHLTK